MSPSASPTFQTVPIDEIEIDLSNPRIARWLEIHGETPSAEEIALALGSGTVQAADAGPSFSSLKQSIRTNGGIIHPIVVNKESSGRLVVIEGNTRVQIYLEFKERGEDGNWDDIPAMIHEALSPGAIDAIRLQTHLVGVRQWDPYSKAKYLNHLRNREHLTFGQIVDFCGGNKRDIEKYIQAYNDMDKYYAPILESDHDFDPTRFSAFVELQSSRVTDALQRSGHSKSDFALWVHQGTISPLQLIRKLPRILQNEKSRAVFLKRGAKEAAKVLDIPPSEATIKDATLYQLARELCRRINEFKYEDLQRLKSEPESEEVDTLRDARDALVDFCDDIGTEAQ